ncbi:1-aminocyclopropane-1-carboxylate deaminase/D-cysteine desulfhydrase [Amycolatopsis magusensis]|uniref:1-aminocyclopropane-1-carboxylate deaminase/D-cysteine desulfhydrase n=1 Tax=Amycolatopsis magusensis TaxID=882444 RepID=UPI003793B669
MKRLDLRLPSPVVELSDDLLGEHQVTVLLKRDDLIHPEFPGNKWRKLKGNIEAARPAGQGTILTFGGAYSNHIRAAAAAGYYFDLRTIGLIRGEEHLPLNETLAYAASRGMELHYLDRTAYRNKTDAAFVAQLHDQFGDFHLIPEGGSNAAGIQGCSEIAGEIQADFDLICCACGTGGTLAGLATGLLDHQRALGFSVLKGGQFLNADVAEMQRSTFGAATDNWTIELQYHFGGYAKKSEALLDFVATFRSKHGIELDWVYEAKMMFGLFDLVSNSRIRPGTRIVAVLSG